MKKKTLVSALEKLKNDLSDSISRLESLKYPEGCLVIKEERGFERLYLQHKEGKRLTYLARERSEDVSLYAQKRYDNQLLKKARAEKLQIEKCLKVLEPDADIEKVYDSMPEALKPYITANEKTDLGYAQRWQKEKVAQARRLKEGEGFSTMRGDVVRSKSEVIIADRLFKAGIPYRYEVIFPMKFEDLTYVYPDFQILKTSTKEVFFWEHLGMMDDPKYANGQIKKISGYARSGYTLGKSLILTFESKERPLDTFCVDGLIETFLL